VSNRHATDAALVAAATSSRSLAPLPATDNNNTTATPAVDNRQHGYGCGRGHGRSGRFNAAGRSG
jgi:hypothetical protein